jgi:glycyl-tRNA synthetase beta chain
VKADILDFFRGRFVNFMTDRCPADAVDAAVAAGCDDLVDAAARIAALAQFKSHPDFEPLAVAFKRVGNIVKEGVEAEVSPALFQDPAEVSLHGAVQGVAASVREKVAARAYLDALTEIATLRGPVDAFFDKVMVMAEDERVKTNRLALLSGIARMIGTIADFAKIAA